MFPGCFHYGNVTGIEVTRIPQKIILQVSGEDSYSGKMNMFPGRFLFGNVIGI